MKSRKEHRIPLSDAAVAVLQQMAAVQTCAFVFAGTQANKPLNKDALANVLGRMGRSDITVHGFRSSFRSWAADRRTPHEVAELALGHAIPAGVERAYQRSDLFEQRLRLMDAWARFCAQPGTGGAEVVALAATR